MNRKRISNKEIEDAITWKPILRIILKEAKSDVTSLICPVFTPYNIFPRSGSPFMKYLTITSGARNALGNLDLFSLSLIALSKSDNSDIINKRGVNTIRHPPSYNFYRTCPDSPGSWDSLMTPMPFVSDQTFHITYEHIGIRSI